MAGHPFAVDMTGRRFGRLVVKSRVPGKTPRYWNCDCDCGRTKTTKGSSLRNGATQSCGCYMRERTGDAHRKHGMNQTAEYSIWTNMKDRCLNKSGRAYKDWGGRGITLCDRWHSFENFFADMGPRPSDEHELDRENNDGPYSPENCRWVVRLVQANNKRNNVHIEISGVTLTVAQWSRRVGISSYTIYKRLRLGWGPKEAVLTPSGYGRRMAA